MLPLAARVGEAEIDEFDFLFPDELQHRFCVGHGCSSMLLRAQGPPLRC